jgi:hypothetical protein
MKPHLFASVPRSVLSCAETSDSGLERQVDDSLVMSRRYRVLNRIYAAIMAQANAGGLKGASSPSILSPAYLLAAKTPSPSCQATSSPEPSTPSSPNSERPGTIPMSSTTGSSSLSYEACSEGGSSTSGRDPRLSRRRSSRRSRSVSGAR